MFVKTIKIKKNNNKNKKKKKRSFDVNGFFQFKKNHASAQPSFVVRAWQEGSSCNDI